MLLASVLVVGALVALYRWCTRPRGVPPPDIPGKLPLIGHIKYFGQIIGNNIEFWNQINDINRFCYHNGGVATAYIGLHKVYYITDPDDGLKVANLCLERPYYYKFANEFLRNGLVTADVQTWKQHRKLLNPRFNLQVLNSFMGVFNEQSHQLVFALNTKLEHGPFDIQPLVIDTLLKIISHTSLGTLPGNKSIVDESYTHAIDTIFYAMCRRLQQIWLHIPFIFNMTALKATIDQNVKKISDTSKSIIDQRKKVYRDDINIDSDKFRPLLDQLLIENEQEGVFTYSDIREHLDTFIIATFDTTATTITYALLLLGSHQDVQEKVYQEVKDIVIGSDVTKHDLPQLVYTEAVVKESLRLYTMVPIVARNIDQDIQLSTYVMFDNLKSCTLQAGNSCAISLCGINRNPGIWGEDADEFRPERWLQPETLPKHPAAFASFSIGKRNCIGRQYGVMLMKTILAHVVKRYQVYSDISQLVLKFELLLKPVSGHEISIKLRHPDL